MKQIFQTHPNRLLLCLLFTLIGEGNFVWGQTATITQSDLGLSGSYTKNTEKTINGITYVYSDLMKNNSNIQAKASSGVIYNKTAYPGNITSVAITSYGTARESTIWGSSDGETWSEVKNGTGSITGDFSKNEYKYFKITRGANAAYWKNIVITYEVASDPVDITSFAFANTTPSVTLSKNGSSYEAEYTQTITTDPDDYDGTVTYAIDEENSTFNTDDVIIDEETGEVDISSLSNVGGSIVVKASGTATSKYNKPDDATYTLTVNAAPAGVGTPTFSLASGSYYYGTTTTINSLNASAIYYTTDGTTPSKSSTLYSGSVAITNTMTLKAIGYDGETASEVASIDYTLKAPEAPTISVASGEVVSGTTVTLTPGEGGDFVVYTTDGSDPTTSSELYDEPIAITEAMTLKAATIDGGNNLSDIVSEAYTIKVQKLYEKATTFVDGGTYIIATEEGNALTSIVTAGSNKVGGVTDLSVVGTKLDNTDGSAAIVTLQNAGDGLWYLLLGESKLSWTSGNTLNVGGTGNEIKWSISESGIESNKESGRKLRYNYNTPRICAYGSSSTFALAYLYKLSLKEPNLVLSKSSIDLAYGDTESFTVTTNSDGDVTVTSSNTAVATVKKNDDNYDVTYVGDGEATITVSVAETATYAAKEETIAVTALDVRDEADISFAKASDNVLIAAGTYTQALTNPNSLTVMYSSSDEDVATVAANGVVTLKTVGTVTITASFAGNAEYKPGEASYTLTIANKPAAELVFNDDAVEKLTTDAPFTNDVTTYPDGIALSYSSSDTEVATVNATSGLVTIVGAGTTTITATINDAAYEATEYTYTLTVSKAEAPLSFSSASVEVALDETESFVAPTLSNAQSLAVSYSSSNPSVATVDAETGVITFVAVGETTITASFEGNATYNAKDVEYTLTVVKGAETLPYEATLASSLGDFIVTEDATLGALWTISASSAKASAYKNGSQNAGESWLVSPVIAITGYATLSFEHADQYFNSETEMKSEATLWIREQGGEWEQLTIATYPTYEGKTKSSFVSTSNSLASYSGKKIQIGFKYLGNTTSAGSWFVKNFSVADSREEAPISFTDATVYELLKNKDTYEGQTLTNDEDLTVSYTSSDTDVATVNASTGVVTIKAVGETTISATYADSEDYKAKTVSYTLIVTNKPSPEIDFAESAVEAVITDGTYAQTLTNPNGVSVSYTSSDETVATVAADGTVTLKKVGETTITATFTEDEVYDRATVSYTLTVIKANPVLNFASASVNASYFEGATYQQAVTTVPVGLPVTYTSSDETVATVAADGTATLLKVGTTTITAAFAGNDTYNSAEASYTLTAAIDYAELPFAFTSGKSTIASTTGLSESGLGSDYSSTANLRFDSTDDHLILKIAEAAGTLSFDIKGNSFSGGTFYVQTSVDGETYKNLDKVSITASVATKTYTDIDPEARFIKWIYAEKSSGNIGLGNISLTAAGNTRPITVTSAGYATYCSNVALDFTGSEIKAYVGTRSGDKLTFTPITQVPAQTGLLLVCAGGTTADVSVIASADAVENNCLTGITKYTELSGTDYILNVVDGQAGFFLTGTAHRELKANRAYIPASVGAGVKSFALDLEDNADGIEETLSDSLLKSENIYNLAGQRLSKMQNRRSTYVKGINIVNGKKILK